jgi:hypothetical protein
MEIIFENEYLSIIKEGRLYKIEFESPSPEIANSLLKTRIIRDGTINDSYQILYFKALKVRTLKQYQEYHKECSGKKNFTVNQIALMVRSLTIQLEYLLTYENQTLLGYNPEEIIVIDDEKFAFLGSELVAEIDSGGSSLAIISCPFSSSEFYFSPEILKIKEIPSYVHYKTCYFSLACLLIYCIEGNDEFYKNYINDININKLIEILENYPIKDTKIHWIIKRCLKEIPEDRSIIYI